MMTLAYAILVIGLGAGASLDGLTIDQKLVVACDRVNLEGVVEALRLGADVNARFGEGDIDVLRDPWDLGWPMSGKTWTPLIALAAASPYPPPPREVRNTVEDWEWAQAQKLAMPADRLDRRRRVSLAILYVLLSHNCDVNATDSHGATALYEAIYQKKEDMAKVLLRFGAKVNTKTGVYIDGAGDITPLHRAFWSKDLTKLLLEKGADPVAKDTEGKTPLDWAKSSGQPEVIRLYKP